MAIFNLSFNTDTKEVMASLDGQAIPDFKYASLYNYGDYGGSITVEASKVEGDITRCETIYASMKEPQPQVTKTEKKSLKSRLADSLILS